MINTDYACLNILIYLIQHFNIRNIFLNIAIYFFIIIYTVYNKQYINNSQNDKDIRFNRKLDIENPIIRINTAFKGCSSLEKISVLPRIYHN